MLSASFSHSDCWFDLKNEHVFGVHTSVLPQTADITCRHQPSCYTWPIVTVAWELSYMAQCDSCLRVVTHAPVWQLLVTHGPVWQLLESCHTCPSVTVACHTCPSVTVAWELSHMAQCDSCLRVVTHAQCDSCLSHMPQCDSCLSHMPQCDSCLSHMPECDSCLSHMTQCDSCLSHMPQCDSCLSHMPQCDSCLRVVTLAPMWQLLVTHDPMWQLLVTHAPMWQLLVIHSPVWQLLESCHTWPSVTVAWELSHMTQCDSCLSHMAQCDSCLRVLYEWAYLVEVLDGVVGDWQRESEHVVGIHNDEQHFWVYRSGPLSLSLSLTFDCYRC